MRFLTVVGMAVASLGLRGYTYLHNLGLDSKGTTISQSIHLAFARKAMIRIADAEREQLVAFNECYSMDQLISTGKLEAGDQARAGYTFTLSCDGGNLDFTVSGTHDSAYDAEPPDSKPAWPVLTIDQSLAFHESYSPQPRIQPD